MDMDITKDISVETTYTNENGQYQATISIYRKEKIGQVIGEQKKIKKDSYDDAMLRLKKALEKSLNDSE